MGDKLDCPFDLILAATILFVKKCKKWEKRITSVKGFSQTWITPHTNSIK